MKQLILTHKKAGLCLLVLSCLTLAPYSLQAKKKHKKEVCDEKERCCPLGNKEWLDLRLCTKVLNVLSNDTNARLAGFRVIPPDPIIAAGPKQVIALTNVSITIFNKSNDSKTLNRVYTAASGNFFQFATNLVVGDPWIVYNEFLDRFFISAFTRTSTTTEFYFAVSKNATPESNNDFHHYRYVVQGEFNDFPKIAADCEVMYLTTNSRNFGNFFVRSQRIDAFDARALAEGPSKNNIQNDPNLFLFFEKINNYPSRPTNGNIQFLFPLQPRPSKCRGAIDQVIFIESRLTNPNTPGFFTGDTVRIHAYLDAINIPFRISTDVDIPPFTGAGPLFAVPQRPPLINPFNQPLRPIEVFLGAFYSGVTSKNSIWASHNIFSAGNPSQIPARWYEIDVKFANFNLVASLKQSGTTDDGSTSSQIWPSINVDKEDNMALQFTLVGPQQYPVIAYTGRHACDPQGTVRVPFQKTVGGDLYYQLVSGSQPTRNRYGDYSGLAIDPCDHKTFWLFNEYPVPVVPTPTFAFGSDWSTFIGSFQINKCGISCNAPQVEIPPLTLTLTTGDIELSKFAEDESPTSYPVTLPSQESIEDQITVQNVQEEALEQVEDQEDLEDLSISEPVVASTDEVIQDVEDIDVDGQEEAQEEAIEQPEVIDGQEDSITSEEITATADNADDNQEEGSWFSWLLGS